MSTAVLSQAFAAFKDACCFTKAVMPHSHVIFAYSSFLKVAATFDLAKVRVPCPGWLTGAGFITAL